MTPLVTAKELAKLLDINIQTIWRKTRRGEIPHYRVGRFVRYKVVEVLSVLKGV